MLTFAILLFGAGGPILRTNFGYLGMAIIAGLVIGLGMLISSFVAPKGPSAEVPRVSLAESYRAGFSALKRSQPFRALLLTFLLQGLATGAMLAGAQYVATWVLSREDAVTFLFVALIAPALLVRADLGRDRGRIGKERTFVIASVLFGVAALSMILLAVAPGPWVYASVALAGAAYAGMQSLPMAMLPDVISHDAKRTATARPASSAASGPRARPRAWPSGATLLTIVLTITGYESAAPVAPRAAAADPPVADRDPRHRARVQRRAGGDHRGSACSRSHATVFASTTSMRMPRDRHPAFAQQPAAILDRLAALRAADAPTHGGRVLSYVYDSGLAELDELAAAAILAVQPVNGLDPTTFTSVAVMEREVVAFARDLLHGDAPR